jgi:hypothetical protein
MAKAPATKAAFNPDSIKEIGHVSIPSLSVKKVKTGDSLYLRYDSEITSKHQTIDAGANKGQPKMTEDGAPAMIHVANVTNMETGEFGQIVIGAIVYSGHRDAGGANDDNSTPKNPVSGRYFKWTKGAESSGKATKWEVIEFEV